MFLDETSFDLDTSKFYGYSPIGAPVYKLVPGNLMINFSLICAIRSTGILCHELVKNPLTELYKRIFKVSARFQSMR